MLAKILKGSRIFVNEDFPSESQNHRRILRPIMKKANASGKKAFLNVDSLIINDKSYTIDTLNSLPQELNPAEIATPAVGNTRAFFGEHSPLSSFHPAKFTLYGIVYEHSEMYLQEKKLFGKDRALVSKVLAASSAIECYRYGHIMNEKIDINAFRKDVELKEMEIAVYANFSQNEYLKTFVIITGDALLAEGNPHDTFWGVGIGLTEREKTEGQEELERGK